MLEDPRLFSPKFNYGAGGQIRRLLENVHAVCSHKPQAVYEKARELATRLEVSHVVEIGVGAEQQLQKAFSGFSAHFLQVDRVEPRKPIVDADVPAFCLANFEDAYDMDALRAQLSHTDATLIILADVIECVDDPRPLLRTIRSILKQHANNRLIVSTRHRTVSNNADNASTSQHPPAAIRQWTLAEFTKFLKSAGLCIQNIELLKPPKSSGLSPTIVAEVACDELSYTNFLTRHMLPESCDHLVVTAEHAQTSRTGGVGTYYQMSEDSSGKKRLVLFCGGTGLPEKWVAYIKNLRWLHAADLCGRGSCEKTDIMEADAYEALDAVLLVVFLYDAIKLIEYQDFLGIGLYIAQAKRARLLPRSVFIMAYAHGNYLYLDHAAGDLSKERDISIDLKERLSVELADCVLFPSRFIENLYLKSAGFQPRQSMFVPLPVPFGNNDLAEASFVPIDTIVFYGKPSKQKGYFDFCEAICNFFKNPNFFLTSSQIKKIVLIGPYEVDERLLTIPEVDVCFGLYSRAEVLPMLAEFSKNALIVLPYKADNHPLSVFEAVHAKIQLLAYHAGGIPEQLPAELHDQLLCQPNQVALTEALHRAIALPLAERVALIQQTFTRVAAMCQNNIAKYCETIESFKKPSTYAKHERGDLGLVVSNFNGAQVYLEDTITGIENSFYRPKKVVFVDDCSDTKHYEVLKTTTQSLSSIPVEIVRNQKNLGSSGTRNAGLHVLDTKYVCAHDNDNILLNNFLDFGCKILDENPEVVAVTSWDGLFNDGDVWNTGVSWDLKNTYRPIGQDMGFGFQYNIFGDVLSVYRADTLKQLHGWDDSRHALWDDWQLFLKLTSLGKQVWVIPKVMFLYRVCKHSMTSQYSNFNGWLRLASILNTFPSNQQLGLIRAIRSSDPQLLAEGIWQKQERHILENENNTLKDEIDKLKDENSVLTHELANFKNLMPVFKHEIYSLRLELNRLNGGFNE